MRRITDRNGSTARFQSYYRVLYEAEDRLSNQLGALEGHVVDRVLEPDDAAFLQKAQREGVAAALALRALVVTAAGGQQHRAFDLRKAGA